MDLTLTIRKKWWGSTNWKPSEWTASDLTTRLSKSSTSLNITNSLPWYLYLRLWTQWWSELMERSRNLRRRLSWRNFKRHSWPASLRGTLSGQALKWEKWLASSTWDPPRSTNGTGTARERELTSWKALPSVSAIIASRWRKTTTLTHKALTADHCMDKAYATAHNISLVKRKLAPRMTLSSLKSKET